MKKVLGIILVVLLFISCKEKISTADKLFIESQITLHNSTFGLQFESDSIDRRSELMSAYMRLGNSESEGKRYADSINNEIYKKDNDKEYNPQSDPHLTFEKFMDYCKKNKYQTPVEQAKFLTP